jgi:hypothetical protein
MFLYLPKPLLLQALLDFASVRTGARPREFEGSFQNPVFAHQPCVALTAASSPAGVIRR